jgi:hypothetical protein
MVYIALHCLSSLFNGFSHQMLRLGDQVVPDRSIVRGEQWIGSDADVPEETDVPETVAQFAVSPFPTPKLLNFTLNAPSVGGSKLIASKHRWPDAFGTTYSLCCHIIPRILNPSQLIELKTRIITAYN